MTERSYFDFDQSDPWIARYRILKLLQKLDVAVQWVICRESLAQDGRYFLEFKLKEPT